MTSSAHILTPPPSGERALPFEELVDRAEASLPDAFPRDPSEVLVALDIDGTLLLPTGVSERVGRSFRDLVDLGVNVVIASGRGINAVRPVIDLLGAHGCWSVCSNGAIIARWDEARPGGAEAVRVHDFDPSWAIDRMDEVVPGILIGVEVAEGYVISEPFPPGEFIEPVSQRPMEELRSTRTPKLVGRAPWMDRADFDAAVKGAGLEERCEFAVGWTSWVDVGPKGCTKAAGLEELTAEVLGLSASGTVAVGDGTNDIPMLRWAAHGVAMGGASEEVRAHADAVTGAVENDGAAAVMAALVRHLS